MTVPTAEKFADPTNHLGCRPRDARLAPDMGSPFGRSPPPLRGVVVESSLFHVGGSTRLWVNNSGMRASSFIVAALLITACGQSEHSSAHTPMVVNRQVVFRDIKIQPNAIGGRWTCPSRASVGSGRWRVRE
jgi:hypothetical protein